MSSDFFQPCKTFLEEWEYLNTAYGRVDTAELKLTFLSDNDTVSWVGENVFRS